MKFVFGLLFSLVCSLGAVAQQQQHFVYIQTEDRQTFYVQMDSAIFSSSATGYLILAQLPDSNYKIVIGFPRNEWTAQQYSFVIKNNDFGFLLKNTGDKWILADIESANIIKQDITDNDMVVTAERTDPFATMLANAVNDPSLKQKLVPEDAKLAAADSVKEVQAAAIPLRSTITKISSKKVAGGTEVMYTDVSGEEQDTIKIFLPIVKKIKQPAKPEADLIVQADDDIPQPQPAVKPVKAKKKDEQFLDMSVTPSTANATQPVTKPIVVKNKIADTVATQTVATAPIVVPVVVPLPSAPVVKKDSAAAAPHMANSECKNLASQEDFIKLRRKMVDQKNDVDMLAVAKKVFRTRCFTTEQIKNLGAIFYGDQGKYNFFETAYEIVADGENYGELKGQLTDPYYVARFDLMLHHQ